MKKLLIILFCFLSVQSFAQTDTALGMNGHRIPIKSLSLLHPLFNPNDSTAAFDSARYYLSTFAYNGTNDSLVITFLDGTRMAVAKPSGGAGGTGSAWKTVNTNDITDTLSGNVAIGNGISTPLAKLQINISGINATQPDSSKGIYIINPDAATSGNQKFSGGVWWGGSNWRNGASASSKVGVNAYLKTVQGNTQGVGYLTFGWQGQSSGTSVFKPDLLTIGAGSEGYGWGVGINASPYNNSGSVLVVGGGIYQSSGNLSVPTPWNINTYGNNFLDLVGSSNPYLRLNYGATYKGTITDKPIAIGRNDSTDLGAQLSVTSTGRGFLFPRMTTTQRDSINLQITGFTVVNGGSGYTGNGTLTFQAGPTPASATTAVFTTFIFTRSSGVVTAVSAGVQFAGSYNNTPTLTAVGGGGTGLIVAPIMTQSLTPGLTIYNTTTNKMQYWNSSAWIDF